MEEFKIGPHLLGRKHVVDERDKNYPMSLALDKLSHVPSSMFWQTGPVLNQGNTPHCVGYAWAGWLMCRPLRTMNGPTGDQIYYAAKIVDGEPNAEDGSSTRSALKVMMKQGRIANYLWAQNLSDLKTWALTKGSFCLGTDWYNDMFSPDYKGFVTPTGDIAGGHEYLCIGYSTAKKAFRFLNSWGADWGQTGRFWMHESDVEMLVFGGNGDACGAVEQKVG